MSLSCFLAATRKGEGSSGLVLFQQGWRSGFWLVLSGGTGAMSGGLLSENRRREWGLDARKMEKQGGSEEKMDGLSENFVTKMGVEFVRAWSGGGHRKIKKSDTNKNLKISRPNLKLSHPQVMDLRL